MKKKTGPARGLGAPFLGPRIWCTLGVDVLTGYDLLENICTSEKDLVLDQGPRPGAQGPLARGPGYGVHLVSMS